MWYKLRLLDEADRDQPRSKTQYTRIIPLIPYYDPADERLLTFLTPEKCERYILDGPARAVRSKRGEIKRLYRTTAARVYISAAAVHAAANRTTTRARGESGVFIGS